MEIKEKKMGKYFGTDGFRGEANKVLTVEHAFKVGRFLGWYYGNRIKGSMMFYKIQMVKERKKYYVKGNGFSSSRPSGASEQTRCNWK